MTKKEKELYDMLRELMDCPHFVVEASIPKGGIDVNPEQVVLSYSVGYLRYTKAKKLLQSYSNA